MKTGLASFDWTLGDLRLGELYCVAGRPCSGKTVLLLDVALRVHRKYRTNVVFATAQELPEQIVAMAPPSARPCLVELPSRELMRDELEFPQGREPCIYLVDVRSVGATWPHYLAHGLNVSQVSRCDLLVSNGWTVTSERGTYIKHVLESVPYRLNWARPPTLLAASTLARANRFAKGSGVASIYAVGTAWHDDQEQGPRAEDLLRLRAAAGRHAARTVLLHRPELYEPYEPGKKLNLCMTELSVAEAGEGESRRTRLQYDLAKRRFRMPARARSRGS